MAINAQRRSVGLKRHRGMEWSDILPEKELRKGLHGFWDKVWNHYPGRASSDLQQMMSGSHMVAQCAGSSLRKAVDSSQSVGYHWLSKATS
jgi:hypothetical protein